MESNGIAPPTTEERTAGVGRRTCLPASLLRGRKPRSLGRAGAFLPLAVCVLLRLGCATPFSGVAAPSAAAPAPASTEPLGRARFRSGEDTLQALAAVSEVTRRSIVKLNVDGVTVALGTVVDAEGLALTKASEIKPGKLTCWLADGREVSAEVVGTAENEDLALVRVHARGLKPIVWATEPVTVGQWAITPGIAETPHALGIVSAPPRRIRPPRAYIGIQFDFGTEAARIGEVYSGMGADQAGMKAGDTILAVNGASVTNREQVVETLRDFRDGQTVKLRVQRGEEALDLDVRMGTPAPDQAASFGLDTTPRRSRLTGALSERAEGFELALQHDTVLQPWLCGGPLVNLEGRAIGLNIARAARVATYALPPAIVKRALEQLRPGNERPRRAGR